jgi:uncharacterized GH25 family protein
MRNLLSFAFVAFLAASATAHDFWIEPETFAPKIGEVLRVRLRVGDFGQGENVPRSEQRIVRFELVGADKTKPLVGRDGQEFAGVARIESEGTLLVGYVSNHAFVELDPTKFAHYLEEKGLEPIAKLRRERNQLDRPARELYSRSAKSLVAVGGALGAGFDRAMDLPLELIPTKNPTALGTRPEGRGFEALPVTLYFEGKPLAGALVAARCLDEKHEDTSATLFARTDAEGRAELPLTRSGRWMIAAVHMRPAPPNERKADWESFWGSLTFEIPAAAK